MVAFLLPPVMALLVASSPVPGPGPGPPTSGGGPGAPPPAVPGAPPLPPSPPPPPASAAVSDLIEEARSRIASRDPDGAFAVLTDAYGLDPTAPGMGGLFESCLRLRIEIAEEEEEEEEEEAASAVVQDRFGLASLLIDQERYEEAREQLRAVVSTLSSSSDGGAAGGGGAGAGSLPDRAAAMLYRTNAACCHWDEYGSDGDAVAASLDRYDGRDGVVVPSLHPFEALKFPCVTLERATDVASAYARRAESAAGVDVRSGAPARFPPPTLARPSIVSARRDGELLLLRRRRREEDGDGTTAAAAAADGGGGRGEDIIRIGYLSPDFTGTHPLAFLMQDVFRRHDRDNFRVYTYSLSRDDGSSEVRAVREGSDTFVVLPPGSTANDMADRIARDDLHVMIDLCGYAGPSVVAELMATRRCAPVQVSYMGFPGSSGASYVDYIIVDPTVVPPNAEDLRKHYTERLVLMPDCYFVNSHGTCAREFLIDDEDARLEKRRRYGLPPDGGFVYCCHSRPDKVDPSTFRTWLRALVRVRKEIDPTSVLWLLRSGEEMERNLREIAREEFGLDGSGSGSGSGSDSALVFCDVVPREEHLRRLSCADLFLDTIPYGAHTVGCDALFAGVPMVSLLRPHDDDDDGLVSMINGFGKGASSVRTDKLASRVGASLLKAAGLGDLVCRDMGAYERLMVRCAEDKVWYGDVKARLRDARDTCPLFDTERWVRHLEFALRQIVLGEMDGDALGKRRDIIVLGNDSFRS